MFTLRALLTAGGVLVAGSAFADDCKTGKQSEKMKIFPKLECRYIKSYPKPHINCGACFGYYPTQWSSWADACGQPETIYVPVPQPEVKLATPKVDDKKPVTPNPMGTEPKPIDPTKKPEVAPAPMTNPKVPDPVPLPDPKPVDPNKKPDEKPPETPRALLIPVPVPSAPATPAPVQATPVSVTMPVGQSAAPVIPLIPTLPAVNVK